MNFLIGADPELFVKKNNTLVSAFGLIEGNKADPFKVKDGAVQVDGMALEFNIDPADSEAQFLFNINSVLAQLAQMVPDHELAIQPVAEFGSDYIKSQPLEAQELGCDPDYNAWSGKENTKPDEELPFRTGAGHIHIGWAEDLDIKDDFNIEQCQMVVRQLDFFLGLPSLVFDSDSMRRSMYGQAGAYRPKPYGVEYRTLSNAWLTDEKLISWVYRATNDALRSLANGVDLSVKYGNIEEIINTSDVKAAMKIIKAEGIELP